MVNIKSMTGYGRAEKAVFDKRIIVEIKSLNSKQNDLLVKLPSSYNEHEIDIRSQIGARLKRGKIFCQISLDYLEGSMRVNINKTLAINYINELKEVSSKAGLDNKSDLLSIALRLPDVVSNDGLSISDEEGIALKEAVAEALDFIEEFRLHEGQILGNDFQMRITTIGNLLKQIDPLENGRLVKIRERIENELNNHGSKLSVDPNRFEQELIFYLEKLDITEEKIRLAKHLDYFVDTMNNDDDEKGKKLGFITQEIGREINTLGSKANDAGMQKLVVQMKDELEKIKEQLLNIL